jgi:UDP-N-acetylmuramoyl-tripeptide--D-alanyl-D-alanine ligase
VATPIPANSVALTLGELGAATGAEVLECAQESFRGITTDSRGDARGKVFVALVGEHFDGHDFARGAVERGAQALLTSRPVAVPPRGITLLRVEDTLAALGALGHWQRRRWGGVLLAVGGSAGKTTTRAVVSAILAEALPGRVHFAPGNLNNLVGVPMVLLGLGEEHRLCVVELGTNHPGEVARLAEMAEPDLALLTLIALEHSAGLGDLDQIESEEGDLLRQLGPAGVAVANGDDPRAVRQLERCGAGQKVRYGTGLDCDYRLFGRRQSSIRQVRLEIRRAGETLELTSPLLGEAGALAVLGGLAAAEHALGRRLDASTMNRALGRPELVEPGRLVPRELRDGTVILDDTYNANPASVRASVRAASELALGRGARLVLVIGEMRELGEWSEREHRDLGALLCRTGASYVCAVGGDACHLLDPMGSRSLTVDFAPDAASALPLVEAALLPGDVVLIKASRGIGAERIVSFLEQSRGVVA